MTDGSEISTVDLIERCRKKFGDPPRDLSKAELSYLRLNLGTWRYFKWWLNRDKLCSIIRDQDELQDHGRVVWSYLVQANSLLFSAENNLTCPGNVVYSPDTFFDGRLDALQEIARSIGELKGTLPRNKVARQFAEAVTDEMKRTLRMQIPEEFCDGRKVYFTTLFFQPNHFPDGFIARGFMPLLISPKRTDATMVLPAKYWPKDLLRLWTED
jgi:hypothetical protein